jgi:excinuclease ABC subunit B
VRVDTGLAEEGASIGHNFEAHLEALQKRMLEAASDLEFEEAARLRDEIKRLRETELAISDDPLARQNEVEGRAGGYAGSSGKPGAPSGSRARKPSLDEMGGRGEVPAGPSGRVRKNTLDEMTVGRTEKPMGGSGGKRRYKRKR